MPETLQALGLLVVVVLPGAAALFGYERNASIAKLDFNERVIRFVCASAICIPYTGLLVWLLWTEVLHAKTPTGFVNYITDRAGLPRAITAWDWSWWLWFLWPLLYVGVPYLGGRLFGLLVDRTKLRQPTPNAWDGAFATPAGSGRLVKFYLRRNQTWVGGLFGKGSIVSSDLDGYPVVYLERAVRLFPDGRFVIHQGRPVYDDQGVLVRLRVVEFLVVVDLIKSAVEPAG